MSYPNPPQEGQSPFEKPSGGQGYGPPPGSSRSTDNRNTVKPPHGQPPQYGQPQYGQRPSRGRSAGPPAQYAQVPPGYFPVFNSQGQQVLVPLA